VLEPVQEAGLGSPQVARSTGSAASEHQLEFRLRERRLELSKQVRTVRLREQEQQHQV